MLNLDFLYGVINLSLEWSDVLLKDVLSKKGYIRGPFGSALKRAEMKSEGIPVYEQQNAIYDNRIFRYYIDEEKYQSLKRFTTYPDDLIISCSGTVGKVSIIKKDDPKGIISQALLTLRVNKDLILPEFLKYFFSSYEGYNSLVSRSTGSVQVNISKRAVIEEIPLKLPPLDVQHKIVHYLSLIDKKIETNEKINKNLYGILLNCFNEIFGHEEKNCKLSDIVNIRRGASPRPIKDYISDAGINWLKISDVTWTEMPFIYKIKEKIIEKGKSKSVFIEKGTLVVSNSATPGIPKFIMVDTCVHDGWLVLNKYGDNLRYYLYFLIVKIRRELINLAYGSVFNNLKTDTLKNYEISKPTEDQLDKFNKMAYPIMEKIDSNTKEIMMLSKLRDTLLPKLMSGEIDVSKINCDLEGSIGGV